MRLLIVLIAALSLPALGSTNKPQTGAEKGRLEKRQTDSGQQKPESGQDGVAGATRPIQTPNCKCQQSKSYDPEKDTLYRWYLRVTTGGVIFGALSLYILYRQHQTARETLKVSQRADVLVEGISLVAGDRNDWGDCKVSCTFHNYGNSRALKAKPSLILDIPGATPAPDDYSILGPITIGNGTGQTVSTRHFVEFLTRETAQGMVVGSIPLKVTAEIVYEDVFGDIHRHKSVGEYEARYGVFITMSKETD